MDFFDKFKLQNDDDWPQWKNKVQNILRDGELMDYVTGKIQKPLATRYTKTEDFELALTKFNKGEFKAQRVIVTALGKDSMLHVMNCANACEMWNKLESTYGKKSKVTIHESYKRFLDLKLESGDSIAVHISNLQSIIQQLKDLGETVSQTMIITQLLLSLPPEFSQFKSSWYLTAVDQQTIENLTSRLIVEEIRIGKVIPNVSAPETYIEYNGVMLVEKDSSNDAVKSDVISGMAVKVNASTGVNGMGHEQCVIVQAEKDLVDKDKLSASNGSSGNVFLNKGTDVRRGTAHLPLCDTMVNTKEITDRSKKCYLDFGESDHLAYRDESLNELVKVRIVNGSNTFAEGQVSIDTLAFDNFKFKFEVVHEVDSSAASKGFVRRQSSRRCGTKAISTSLDENAVLDEKVDETVVLDDTIDEVFSVRHHIVMEEEVKDNYIVFENPGSRSNIRTKISKTIIPTMNKFKNPKVKTKVNYGEIDFGYAFVAENEYGIDYQETFSRVNFTLIWSFIAMVAEEIYMKQSQGYEDGTSKICKHQKSLHVFEQASRCWNENFAKKVFHFQATSSDTVFTSENKATRNFFWKLSWMMLWLREINVLDTKYFLESDVDGPRGGTMDIGILYESSQNVALNCFSDDVNRVVFGSIAILWWSIFQQSKTGIGTKYVSCWQVFKKLVGLNTSNEEWFMEYDSGFMDTARRQNAKCYSLTNDLVAKYEFPNVNGDQ